MKGTIDKPPGAKRWRLRIYVSGKQESSWHETEADAKLAREAQNIALAETAADYEGETVARFGHKVLTRRELKRKVRDPDSDWSRFHEHVRDDLVGRVAVRAVQGRHIYSWLERLEDKGLAPQTRRNCLSLLRTIFRAGHKAGLCKSNPCMGVRVEGKDLDAWTYLTREELPRILEAFPPIERHIAAVAIGTGMRPGELVSLRWSDGFLDDRPRIVVRYGSPPNLPTKTGSVRTVPLFGLSLTAMRAWFEILPELEWPNPERLVFPRERGGFRDKDHLVRWEEWKAVLQRAGITRRFRWYDFRHTCASWLVSGWWGPRWSLQEVKEMLGHSSITITQRYAHLAASSLEERAKETGLDHGQIEGHEGHQHLGRRGPHIHRIGYGSDPQILGHDEATAERLDDQVKTSQPQAQEVGRDFATEVYDKIPELLLAPPPGIEPETVGLGIRGLSRSEAEIRAADLLWTYDEEWRLP